MDQIAQDILNKLRNELVNGNSGAMQEEKQQKTKYINDGDQGVDGYLTQQDNQTLLINKNKAKTTHLNLHQEIDFKESRSVALEDFPENLIPSLNERYQENFLNVTIQEKIQALKDRYAKYEEMMEKHLSKKHGLKYSRVHPNDLSNETQIILIGYIRGVEEDRKIKLENFLLDCLNPNDGAYCVNCFIDPDQIELVGFETKGLLLAQNKLITVLGQQNDEQEIQILKIYASPAVSTPLPVNHPISTHYEVMVFAGPYSFDGSEFTAFRPIFEIVANSKPSLVILIGPFFDRNLAVMKKGFYTNFKNKEVEFDFQQRRQNQIGDFCKNLSSKTQGKTKVAIIPDSNEVDCMYPYPVPQSALDFEELDEVAKVYSSPALISLDGKVNIAINSSDIFLDLAKNSSYELGVDNRYHKGLETILEQKNLMPFYPSLNSTDLSKTDAMSYNSVSEPDVYISKSNLTQQLSVIRGVTCMIIQPSAFHQDHTNEFKSYGLLKIAVADKVRIKSYYFRQEG